MRVQPRADTEAEPLARVRLLLVELLQQRALRDVFETTFGESESRPESMLVMVSVVEWLFFNCASSVSPLAPAPAPPSHL